MMRLALQPISSAEARAFIRAHHRHHLPAQGWVVGTAANYDGVVVGVVTIGRPVARGLQDGYTCEVTRCCVLSELPEREGHPLNVASFLYGAAWRAARALGYRRMLTYTLKDETGASLVAAGWKCVHSVRGGGWDRPNRARVDKHPTQGKFRWEVTATPPAPPAPRSAD